MLLVPSDSPLIFPKPSHNPVDFFSEYGVAISTKNDLSHLWWAYLLLADNFMETIPISWVHMSEQTDKRLCEEQNNHIS